MAHENDLILYYSFTGNTRTQAQATQRRQGGTLVEVTDQKPHGIRWAYLVGCFNALRHKGKPIQPLEVDFSQFDHFTVLSPIWASNLPPAVNTLLALLPAGSTLSLHVLSASGRSARENILFRLRGMGLRVDEYVDVKV